MINSDLVATGRQIRTAWREEEEAFIEESSHYSRKQLSLLEYLSSVAHAGHSICVHTPASETSGMLSHLGEDYFSISPSDYSTHVVVYVVNNFSSSKIEIDVLEKENKSWKTALFRLDKSFHSLIDELSTSTKETEIETVQGNIHRGKIQMLKDSIVVTPTGSESKASAMVEEGTTILPLEAVVALSYDI